ncbi:hypothetical protein PoB_002782400 [Plakobranchus ocellatus]|uniref:Granulins domain-containing protein n=1 Tax=Plakobranchus ocellatus TaxID=259542 RepID=A0AAV4A516_9GAST|nr:hypothetical protein PoB_002782400 [Plakobranchus ocellatus]
MIVKILLSCLTLGAALDLARADGFELDDDVWAAFFASLIIGNAQNCARSPLQCSAALPCCQYFGRVEQTCSGGQCVQAVCGAAGDNCGLFIGECCFSQGLQCTDFLSGGSCQLPSGRK